MCCIIKRTFSFSREKEKLCSKKVIRKMTLKRRKKMFALFICTKSVDRLAFEKPRSILYKNMNAVTRQ